MEKIEQQAQELATTDATLVQAQVLPSTPFQTMYNRQIFRDEIQMANTEDSKRLSYGEYNDGKSETVPDQSLTVGEIVYRFSRGLPLTSRNGEYDPENDDEIILPPNWTKMDISERMDFLAEKRDEVQEISKRYNDYRNELYNKQREEEIERRVNEKLQSRTAALQSREQTKEGDNPNQLNLPL